MNKSSDFILTCYAKLMGSLVASVCLFGVVSYLLDLGKASTGVFIGVSLGWAIIVSLWDERHLNIFRKEWVRRLLWYIIFTALAGANCLVANYTHSLRNSTLEVSSMSDALNSGKEYIHIGNADVDLQHRGLYKTYHISSHRGGIKKITFEAYVVHPFKGVRGAYWGYRLHSEKHRYSFASDKELNQKENDFYAALEGKIQERETVARTEYFQRVQPNDEDYVNYQNACEACNDTCNYAAQSLVVFNNIPESKESSSTYWINVVIIGSFVFAILMALFFMISEKSIGKYNHLARERNIDAKSFLKYISTKKNWWAISLVLLILGYYIVAMLNGYHGDGRNLIYWGGIAKYTLVDNGEWWRLISSALMHSDFQHLIMNLITLVVFIIINPWYSKSCLIWITFFVSAVIAALVCVFLVEPNCIYVGASAGIMGLFGTKIAVVIQKIWEIYNSKDLKHVGDFMGYLLYGFDAWLVVIPTLIFSFGRGVSMAGHIVGLLAGIAIGLIYNCSAPPNKKRNWCLRTKIIQNAQKNKSCRTEKRK